MLKVTNVMKVVEVGAVEMSGKLDYQNSFDPDIPGGWAVYDGHKAIRLEDWLEKFDGRTVTITIRAHGQPDESALLDGASEEAANA